MTGRAKPAARIQSTATAAAAHTAMKAEAVQAIGLHDGRIRAVVESVTPTLDAGRFPVKRIVGDTVIVEADCFADGHDVVACDLKWRHAGSTAWSSTTMVALGNDRWRAEFSVDAIGVWQFAVHARVDPSCPGDTTSRDGLISMTCGLRPAAGPASSPRRPAAPGLQATMLFCWRGRRNWSPPWRPMQRSMC